MTSLNKKSQRKQYINLLTLLFRQLISFLYRTHTCFFDNYEKHEGKNEKKKDNNYNSEKAKLSWVGAADARNSVSN